MKKIKLLIPLLITVMLLGCGAKSSSDMASTEGSNGYEQDKMEIEVERDFADSGAMDSEEEGMRVNVTAKGEKKIIDRANLTIETLKFEDAIKWLENSIQRHGGYMESSNVSHPGIGSNNYRGYRNAEFIVRIPKADFKKFLKETANMGIITNENSSSEDITKEYYDTETRLKIYKAQEERYLELLKEAKTMEDILTIEKQLTEVRYNIEYLTGLKNQMNDLVDYAAVTIHLYEVDEPTKVVDNPKTFGDKIAKVFVQSLESLKQVGTTLILITVAMIPYIIIFGILCFAILWVFKKIRKNKK